MTNTTSSIRWSPSTPITRIRVQELMDDPALDPREHHAALTGLKRLNAWSKSARILWPKIESLAKKANANGQSLRVMDVATGSGDGPMAMAKLARRRGLKINWTLCDCSSRALEVAQQNANAIGERVNLLRIDLLREQIPVRSDVVICSLFMHHLDDDTGRDVLRTMASAADVAVGIADLDRSNTGLALAWIGSRVLTRSRVVHFDAIASVRAAFTLEEAQRMAHDAGLRGASLSRAWPARWRLWWERPSVESRNEACR
ncbi:MAG: methyltransferase domain-containing protein [Planctomycetota bacterium]|nr:methyltransferase domain-containing protein [Planctomycetota bacterium]